MKLVVPLFSAAASTAFALPNPDGHSSMEPYAEGNYDMDMEMQHNKLEEKLDKIKDNLGSIRQGQFTKKMMMEMQKMMDEYSEMKSEQMKAHVAERMEEKIEMVKEWMMEYASEMQGQRRPGRPESPRGEGRPNRDSAESPYGYGEEDHHYDDDDNHDSHDQRRPAMNRPNMQFPAGSQGQIYVNGDMIFNAGGDMAFSEGSRNPPMRREHGDEHDEDDHDDEQEFDIMRFARRMYDGYDDYVDCMHTVKYMILKEIEGKSVEEVQTMVYGDMDMDHASGDDMPMVRKRRAGHGDHGGNHGDENHEAMPYGEPMTEVASDHDDDDDSHQYYEEHQYGESDMAMNHENDDDFPMTREDVEEYMQFNEEGNSISKFYMEKGEWLTEKFEAMSAEEMAEMNEYFNLVGSFMTPEAAMTHQYVMPYLDFMQYKFCHVRPIYRRMMREQRSERGERGQRGMRHEEEY